MGESNNIKILCFYSKYTCFPGCEIASGKKYRPDINILGRVGHGASSL